MMYSQFLALIREKQTCIPLSAGNSSVDDVPAIRIALSRCGNQGTIIIPAGKTFTIRTPLDFGKCIGCQFQIEGTLKISNDLNYWEGKTAFFLISNVRDATFTSLSGSGLIDGNGQEFWDHFARNKTYRRPLLIQISNSSDINFNKITLKNAPFWFFFVTDASTNIRFSRLVLTAVSLSQNRPANTDGFDTGDCSHVTIENVHVTNGDDCVSFKNGSNYITVQNITCIGSHGLSIGSLGLDPNRFYTVQNVYISDAHMINSTTASRIKFYPGTSSNGTVSISNITYKNIVVSNCDYAFQMDNCYQSDPSTCKRKPSTAVIFQTYLINLTGTTSNNYDPVVAKIDCSVSAICELTFMKWNILAPSGSSTVLCSNYEHLTGITCTPNSFY